MITDQDLFVKLAKGRQRTLARIEALPEAERGQKAGLIPLLRAAKPIERVQPDLPVYTPRMGNPGYESYSGMNADEIRARIKELQREASEDSKRTMDELGQKSGNFPKDVRRPGMTNWWVAGHNIWRDWKLRAARRRIMVERFKSRLGNLERGGNPLAFRTSRGEMSEAEILEAAREAEERGLIQPDYRHASTAARWLDSAGVIRLEGAKLMREKNPPMLVLGNPGSTKGSYPFAQKEKQYRGYTDEMLHYAKLDANKAAQAMRGHDPEAEAWYMDDVSTIWKEVNRRRGPGPRPSNPPLLVLGNPKSGPADSTAAEELELFITNDADLYRQQFWPIVKNLMHRQMKGDFDFEKSVKLWGYFVDNGAKKYIKEHGSPGQKMDSMFNKNTRLIVARSLANSFVTEAEYGNYDKPSEGLRWGRGGNPEKVWFFEWHGLWGYIEADSKREAQQGAADRINSQKRVRGAKPLNVKPSEVTVERRKGNPLTSSEMSDLSRRVKSAKLSAEVEQERGQYDASLMDEGFSHGLTHAGDLYGPKRMMRSWRSGNPQIRSMDDASWKKATKAQKIHWLQNVIAYQKATARPGVPDTMAFYWLKKYEKKLASLQRGGNPHDEGDPCPQCGGDLMSIGQLGNLEWYRCRACGGELSQKAEGFHGTKMKPKEKVKRGKNPSELPAHIANDPAFKKELAAFHKRHGNIPVRVKIVSVPNGFPKYMSAYGEAPEAKYDAPKGSKKGKRYHTFGKKGKGRPCLVSSVEKGPKFLAYVGGKFKAKTDWLHD